MAVTVSATELGRNLADYLNRVTYRGESFVVQRGGRRIAELRPVPRGIKGSDFLSRYASLPRLGADEAEALAQDLEAARAELNTVTQVDPWDS